jgi:hypothetical protein
MRVWILISILRGGLEMWKMLNVWLPPLLLYLTLGKKRIYNSPEDDQFSPPYILEIRPSSEFSYDAARVKLVNLKIDSDAGPQINYTIPGDAVLENLYEAGNTGRQAKLLRLSAWIDMDSRLTVCIVQGIPAFGGKKKLMKIF